MENALKTAALDAYRTARAAGYDPEIAAAAAWSVVRAHPEGRHLRAPCWHFATDSNKSNGRRSYRLPLGEIVYGSEFSDLGGHAGKWRRTVKSYAAVDAAVALLLSYLERDRIATIKHHAALAYNEAGAAFLRGDDATEAACNREGDEYLREIGPDATPVR